MSIWILTLVLNEQINSGILQEIFVKFYQVFQVDQYKLKVQLFFKFITLAVNQ